MNLTQRFTFLPLAALAALGTFLLPARPVRAQSLITIGNVVSAAPGGSGSFDVLLTAVNGPLSIGAFTVEPFLNASGGVTFTAADFSTTAPYIFPDSFDQASGLTLTNEGIDPFPNTDLNANDTDNSSQNGGNVTIASGSTVGLAHVTYKFDAADMPGSVYTVNFNSGGTSLADGTGTASYSFTTAPGPLTVTPSAAPEPSGWAAMGFAGLFAAGTMLRAFRRKTGDAGRCEAAFLHQSG